MEALKYEVRSEGLVLEAWETRQARLYRERALKRLKRFAFKAWRVYPWVAARFAIEVTRACWLAVWSAVMTEPELFLHEEPGKPPLRRVEWERHYMKSPKIF